jgi:oligoribonuclease NrnB/cAMP/cGMP phosphodiesterase (DHH superfamily)
MKIKNEYQSDVVVLYHAQCADGFGAAHVAHKVLGESATYYPVKHGHPYPDAIVGANVLIVDFSYPKEVLNEIEGKAQSLTVLDHHKSAADDVTSIQHGVFDNSESGATLAWQYFHPSEPVPRFYAYVRGGDLFDFSLPNAESVLSYIYSQDRTWTKWTELKKMLDTDEGLARAAEIGTHYRTHWSTIIKTIAEEDASLVQFEGYTVYAVNASHAVRSDLGHYLSEKKPPFAIVWRYKLDEKEINFNLRGDGSIDVSELAKKYGGGGHHDAAGFGLPLGSPLPFTPLT